MNNENDNDLKGNEELNISFMSEIQALLNNILSMRDNISNLIEVKDMTVNMKLPPNMLVSVVRTVSELHRSFCELERGVERLVVSFKLACPSLFHETKRIREIIQKSNHVKNMLQNTQKKIEKIEKKENVLRNQFKWNAWQKIFVTLALRNFHRNRWAIYITEMKSMRKRFSLSDYVSSVKSRSLPPTRIDDLNSDSESLVFTKENELEKESCDWTHFLVTTATQTDLSVDNEGIYGDMKGLHYQLKEIVPTENTSQWSEEWKYDQCLLVQLRIPPSDYSISLIVDDITHFFDKNSNDPRNIVFPLLNLSKIKQIKVIFKQKDKVVLLGIIPQNLLNSLTVSDITCSVLPDLKLTAASIELESMFDKFSGIKLLDGNSTLIRLHSVDDTWPDIEFIEFSIARLWYCIPDSVNQTTMTDPDETPNTYSIAISTDIDFVDKADMEVSTNEFEYLMKEENSQHKVYSKEDFDEASKDFETEKTLLIKKYEDQIKQLETQLSLKASKNLKVEISDKINREKKFSSSAEIKKSHPSQVKTRTKSALSKRELYDLGKPLVKPFKQKTWCLASQVIENQKITKYSAMVHPYFYPISYGNKTRENTPPSMLSLPPIAKAKGIGIVNLYNTCIKINQK